MSNNKDNTNAYCSLSLTMRFVHSVSLVVLDLRLEQEPQRG